MERGARPGERASQRLAGHHSLLDDANLDIGHTGSGDAYVMRAMRGISSTRSRCTEPNCSAGCQPYVLPGPVPTLLLSEAPPLEVPWQKYEGPLALPVAPSVAKSGAT